MRQTAVGGVLVLRFVGDRSDEADNVVSSDQLAKLWHEHSAKLLLIARAIGEPAEDAVQEAFIRLSQQSELPDEPMAWLVRVTRNQLLTWHRSGKRQSQREHQYAQQLPWFGPANAEAQLNVQELTSALKQLPTLQRQIVVMHIWGQLTFDQIASEVDMSRASAHRRFQDAITQLRQALDGEAAAPSDAAAQPITQRK